MKKLKVLLCILAGIYIIVSCRKDAQVLTSAGPAGKAITTPYKMTIPVGFPQPIEDPSNPMTVEGVKLGRYLFYDSTLSEDNKISCASCHKQKYAFSDGGHTFSTGVHGRMGNRNAMALFNLAWDRGPFFWNGRAKTLQGQAGMPVLNGNEMNLSWDVVILRLKASAMYQDMFAKAFGKNSITKENATKAIAQFVRSIVSGNSRYDRFALTGDSSIFSATELMGCKLFFGDPPLDISTTGVRNKYEGVNCFHCHSTPTFFPEAYLLNLNKRLMGNGVGDSAVKVPSVRNLLYTAPYMHNGSLADIDAVLEHYSKLKIGDKNQDSNMFVESYSSHPRMLLDADEKAALKAFLLTLTDSSLLTNPEYSNPFIK